MPSLTTLFKNDINSGGIHGETIALWTKTKKGEEVFNAFVNTLTWFHSSEYNALATASEKAMLDRESLIALGVGAYACLFKKAPAKKAYEMVMAQFMEKFNVFFHSLPHDRKELWVELVTKDGMFAIGQQNPVASDMD